MSEQVRKTKKRCRLLAVGLGSLTLGLLLVLGFLGGRIWHRSQLLPLPAATVLQSVELGINLGSTKTEWHALPLPIGKQLVDIFRESVAEPPTRNPDTFVEYPAPEYSLRLTDRDGGKYVLSFRLGSRYVSVADSWAECPLYTLPEKNVSPLKKSLQQLLSTSVIAGGSYAYLAGETDQDHYARISNLIIRRGIR